MVHKNKQGTNTWKYSLQKIPQYISYVSIQVPPESKHFPYRVFRIFSVLQSVSQLYVAKDHAHQFPSGYSFLGFSSVDRSTMMPMH